MKKTIVVLIVAVLSLLALEVFLGYILWSRKADIPSALYTTAYRMYLRVTGVSNIDVQRNPNTMFVPDEYLGYADRPGSYAVRLRDNTTGRMHAFHVTIDSLGNRITSLSPERHAGQPGIWILGDSFTYGWGNNDETTFPFFLQEFLPDFQVVNFGGNGYGNVQGYLQLKRSLEETKLPPAIIVVVYGNYFNIRNVDTPGRLLEYARHPDTFRTGVELSAYAYPSASIGSGGHLRIMYAPIYGTRKTAFETQDSDTPYHMRVTMKLLDEMAALGRRNGTRMVLAFIQGVDTDDVVRYASRNGYRIADIRPRKELHEWDDFNPLDGHPGPLAQDNYARKLFKTIRKAINPELE